MDWSLVYRLNSIVFIIRHTNRNLIFRGDGNNRACEFWANDFRLDHFVRETFLDFVHANDCLVEPWQLNSLQKSPQSFHAR